METRKRAPQLDKKRYATYLRPESIRKLRRYAFERDVPDYLVVQQAIDDYLREHSALRLPIG